MCSILIDVFGRLSERGDGLEQLGSLLAAGFRSTHKFTINQMIGMWNTTFGSRKHLAYPEALKAALERLQPFVDLELPGFEIDAENVYMSDAPFFVDSQDEDVQDKSGFTESSNDESKSIRTHSLVSPSPWKSRRPASPSEAPEIALTAREPTPVAALSKPKRRQDDSQIQYVTIESSPLQDIETESQHLTDRQKEVRARRQAEPAVVFPDLRSIPLLSNGVLKAPRDKNLSLHLKETPFVEDEEPATPTLPMHVDGDGDDAMASSPTPQSKQPALRLDDIEVPSSPPSMPGVAGVEEFAELVSSHVVAARNAGSSDGNAGASLYSTSYSADEAPRNHADDVASDIEEEMPTDLDTLDNDGDIDNEALTDNELQEHFPELASLLSAGNVHTSSPMPLEQLATTAGLEVTAPVMSGRNKDNPETQDIFGGVMIECIEYLHEDISDQPAITAETEEQHQDVDGSFIIQNAKALATNESNHEREAPMGETTLEVEITEVRPPGPTDASQAEQEKQADDDLQMHKDHSNSSTSDGQVIPGKEANHFAALSDSSVLTRDSPLATPESHPDSDEVDMLSASQLSQDLDWHVAVEERSSLTEMSPEAEVKAETRKRKRSFAYSTAVKRRKSPCSPTGREHPILAQPSGAPGQVKDTEEIFDCIVVDTTPRPRRAAQSFQLSQDAVNSQEGCMKRGRKPKQLRNAVSGQALSRAESTFSSQREVVVEMGVVPVKEEHPSEDEVAIIASSESRSTSSPQTALTMARQDKGNSTLRGGTALGSPRRVNSLFSAANPTVSVMMESTALVSAEATNGTIEASGLTNMLQAADTTDAHTLLDGQVVGLGPDMVDWAVPPPAQHGDLSPGDGPLQSPKMPASSLPEANVPVNWSGAADLGNDTPAKVDVIGSLQQILKQLKSASMGKPALREMEDLLFEIRTEAQHAVGRQIAKQGGC